MKTRRYIIEHSQLEGPGHMTRLLVEPGDGTTRLLHECANDGLSGDGRAGWVRPHENVCDWIRADLERHESIEEIELRHVQPRIITDGR